MLNIKSIHPYEDNALGIIEDYDYELFNSMSDDLKDAIFHLDDWEPIVFFTINNDTVIIADSISDQVFDSMPIAEFISQTIKAGEESLKEYTE